MKKVSMLLVCMFMLHANASAQNTASPEIPAPGPQVMFYQGLPAPPPGAVGIGAQADFLFVAPGADKVVTGAPYTAEAVTESIQVLADGNRISNKVSASLARDSQGRTRRQEIMGNVGPLPFKGPRMTFISDPVSKTDYVLDLDRQTARVIKRQNVTFSAGAKIQSLALPPGAQQIEQAKTESLGTRVIDGVFAQGQRTTRTIAAGKIGNELPLDITSEVWFSPELQVVISSEHNDPRFGKTIYTLTNIQRADPGLSLFEVPAGYTISESPISGPAFGIRVGPPNTFELPLPPPGLPSIEGGAIQSGPAGAVVGAP